MIRICRALNVKNLVIFIKEFNKSNNRMISIVVSSYQEPLYQSFVNSVEKTIGVPYEIIKVENPGIMGICKAYNLGVSKAKYDIVCFSHEDVLCYSENWGKRLYLILMI